MERKDARQPRKLGITGAGTWFGTDDGVINMGTKLGLPARPGENMPEYRERVMRGVAEAAKAMGVNVAIVEA